MENGVIDLALHVVLVHPKAVCQLVGGIGNVSEGIPCGTFNALEGNILVAVESSVKHGIVACDSGNDLCVLHTGEVFFLEVGVAPN